MISKNVGLNIIFLQDLLLLPFYEIQFGSKRLSWKYALLLNTLSPATVKWKNTNKYSLEPYK